MWLLALQYKWKPNKIQSPNHMLYKMALKPMNIRGFTWISCLRYLLSPKLLKNLKCI